MLENIEMLSVLGQKLQDAIEAAEARKAIEAWEQPTQTTQPTEPMTTTPTPMNTLNLTASEATFNVARDNPGLTKYQIAELVGQQGHRIDTATTMVGAMANYGLLRIEDGAVFAVGDKYRSRVAFNRGLAKKRKVTKKGEERKEIRLIRRPAPAEEATVTTIISDPINHPEHYKVGGIETIDFIRAKLTPEEFRGYLKGNVMKYVSRAGHKDNALEDAGKLAWYAKRLAELA
jgi:hypothetical protein